MTKRELKKDVIAFLKDVKLGALSTVSAEGKPQISSVYFGVDGQFNIYIVTGTQSRKYINLQHNSEVAMVMTDSKKIQTVQLEGNISPLKTVKKDSKAVDVLAEALSPSTWETLTHIWDPIPPVLKMQNGDLVILKITPSWIRWADFSRSVDETNGDFFELINFKN